MQRAKVALGLRNLNASGVVELTRFIVDTMTTNSATFATPAPPLASLTTAANELEQAQAQKKVLGIVNRNNKRTALSLLLYDEAEYVENIANGDGAVIDLAGMPRQKEPSPQPPPGEVEGLKLVDGPADGEIVVSHKGASGRGNVYFVQYSLDPALAAKGWVEMEPTRQLRLKVKSLPSGRKVAFRVRANNTAGFGPWSTVGFRTVQ